MMHIGIDIGGTKTAVVLVDDAGDVVASRRASSGYGGDDVIARAIGVVEELLRREGRTESDIGSVGVGVPGAVSRGVVRHSMNLGLDHLPLADVLRGHWRVPVTVDNDVNAAAFAAYVANSDRVGSLAYLNLGTGVAAGIVLDGRLWRGARGAAGEIGQISLDPMGPVGADGTRGMIETSASGSGFRAQGMSTDVRSVGEMFGAARPTRLQTSVREGLVKSAAAASRMLLLAYDVELVLIGGGLSKLGEPLLRAVRDDCERWGRVGGFKRDVDASNRIELAPADAPLAAIGAAMLGAVACSEFSEPKHVAG